MGKRQSAGEPVRKLLQASGPGRQRGGSGGDPPRHILKAEPAVSLGYEKKRG